MNFKIIKLNFKTRHKRIHIVWSHLYKTLKNTNVNYSDGKQIRGCMGLRVDGDFLGRYTKGLCKGAEDLYFDCGSGYTGVYFCQNSSNCTLKMGTIKFTF